MYTNSDEQTIEAETADRMSLAKAIKKLSPRKQAVICLRTMGYTQNSVTSLLGVSRTTIWADEVEALCQLKGLLGASYD